MTEFRSVNVRDCQGTLWALYTKFQGQALASFEGDLSNLDLQCIEGAGTDQTPGLKRQTSQPALDFITVPINDKTLPKLKVCLSEKKTLGRDGKIIHTQIALNGDAIFIACDNFHEQCTVISRLVPEEFLDSLIDLELIRGYGT